MNNHHLGQHPESPVRSTQVSYNRFYQIQTVRAETQWKHTGVEVCQSAVSRSVVICKCGFTSSVWTSALSIRRQWNWRRSLERYFILPKSFFFELDPDGEHRWKCVYMCACVCLSTHSPPATNPPPSYPASLLCARPHTPGCSLGHQCHCSGVKMCARTYMLSWGILSKSLFVHVYHVIRTTKAI